MPERSVSQQKQLIRQEYKKLRDTLDNSYATTATEKIAKNFYDLVISKSNITSIGLYWPVNSEIDITPIIKKLRLDGFVCALTRIDRDKMDFVEYTENSTMQQSQFSFYEPTGSKLVIPDIIAVPLLTCDTQRNRLGYGKGFYDRYLTKNKSVSVGISYGKLIYNGTLPQESHDIKLDAVVTESTIII